MSRLLPIGLLPLVILLGGLVRLERGLPAGAVDEHTASHLRRVELALLEGRPPLADTFVDPPSGASLPDAPFLDGVLASVASRLWITNEGTFGPLEEERLESGLRWFGPLFGCLGVLMVALLTLALHSGAWGGFAALVAGTSHALWPAAIDLGGAGRVDVAVLQLALAGIGATIVAQTASARDGFEWVQGGLCGGLFAGVALLLGPSAFFSVPVLVACYWGLVAREEGERRHAARRAGLLFVLSAAVVTSLAAGSLDGEGIAARWVRGVSALTFAFGAPFLVAGALAPGRRAAQTRLVRGAGALAALVLIPYCAVDLAPRLWQGAELWWIAPIRLPEWPLLLAAGVAWLAAWRERRSGGPRRFLAWSALLLVPLSLLLPAAGPPAAVCACVVLGLAVAGFGEAHRVPLAGVLSLSLAGLLLVPKGGVKSEPERSAALRCLRALSPAPWEVSTGRVSGSCLAPWSLGHRIAYLGRQPPVASGYGQGAREAAAALARTDEDGLARGMRTLGARYVLGGSIVEDAWPEALAGRPYGETALARLSSRRPTGDSPFVENLRLGDPESPLLVVLSLAGADPEGRREPTLRAR